MTLSSSAFGSSSPGFSIVAESEFEDANELWATCEDVEGFFTCPDNPEGRRFIGLLNSSVSGALLEYCEGRHRTNKVHANAHLQVLDVNGGVIGSYFMTVLGSYDCVRCRDAAVDGKEQHAGPRYDATLDIMAEGKPPAVREIWRRWRHALPNVNNLWADYPPNGRLAWLDVVRSHDHPGLHPDAEPGKMFELDGQYVTDSAGLYCAIGEAVNGPGGYFGADLGALNDCLGGGFGAQVPFTLRWHNFDVAARHLNEPLSREGLLCDGPPSGHSNGPEGSNNKLLPQDEVARSYLDQVLKVLEEKLVKIVPA
jgi:hypothetical protein